MTYERFKDLPVWQATACLYDAADDFLANAPPHLRLSFRDQLERAVHSVSNNIAEGFERGTTNELLAFLYIARGSAGEVRSMLRLLLRRPWMKDFKSQISDLISARRQAAQKQSAAAFQKKLLASLPPDHPLRRQHEDQTSEI